MTKKREPSSALPFFRYDPKTRRLHARYVSGIKGYYTGVTAAEAKNLRDAESRGQVMAGIRATRTWVGTGRVASSRAKAA